MVVHVHIAASTQYALFIRPERAYRENCGKVSRVLITTDAERYQQEERLFIPTRRMLLPNNENYRIT
jgi:hypothetical protein